MAYHHSAEDLLIVVDFQNVYLPGNEWGCPRMPQAMENTLRLLRSPHAPAYILTKFVAPEKPVGCWQRYNETYAAINADEYLCDLADAVKPIATADNVLCKDTYSSLDSAPVAARLAGKKRVVLSGVVAECCVLATMLDAVDLGYEVIYLCDCIAGCTAEYEASAKNIAEILSPVHTRVMTSEEYLRSVTPE